MVNKKNESEHQADIEITNEDGEMRDPDLTEIEEAENDVLKTLRTKLKNCEAEKRSALEESQRAKADFLNAKRRLEEDRVRDRERGRMSHVEELIPLCDSFEMAMHNKEVWEKADETWRKGVEGIYAQLEQLLAKYGVSMINPVGETFDPHRHEALGTTPVETKDQHDKITAVIQSGYEIKHAHGKTELIRPARVTIGIQKDN